LSLFSFMLFSFTDSFWPILLVNCLFLVFWSPAMPLMESLTMQSSIKYGFDYGRVRVWGSITFVIAAVAIGHILKRGSNDLIFSAIVVMIALTCISAFWLPDFRTPPRQQAQFTFLTVLQDRRFVLFLIGTSLIQASHAIFYAFGSIHWQRAGIGTDVIGWLWAEGVTVEIILFIFGPHVLAKVGPTRLIALAGLAGAIRWTGTAFTTELPALVVLQALHGITFGAAHLGAMHFIQKRIAPELSATAQSLYASVVMGIGMGLAMLSSGYLYDTYAGHAYLPMAALATVGGFIIFSLRHKNN